MKVITFNYRDGANYKWDFNVKIPDQKLKSLEKKYGKLKEGTEILYDNDLSITQYQFHEERGYSYDNEIDHNIITVISVTDEDPTEYCHFDLT